MLRNQKDLMLEMAWAFTLDGGHPVVNTGNGMVSGSGQEEKMMEEQSS